MSKYLMSEKTASFLRRLMSAGSPKAAPVATRLVRPTVAEESDFAKPYEISFDSSLGGGEPGSASAGKWIIWLPDSALLMYGDTLVTVTTGLTAAGDPYPVGWYALDPIGAATGGDVYLVITPGPPAVVEWSDAASTTSGDISIKIAHVSVDASGIRRIVQYVDSAIILRTASDLGRFAITDKDDPSEGKSKITFTNCYYRIGGKTYEMGTAWANVPASSIVAVKVDMSSVAPTAQFVTYPTLAAMQADEADVSCYVLPLYKFDSNWVVACDFRIGVDASAGEF